MKDKKIIGISGSMIIDNGGSFPGYKRSYVNNDYVQSVIKAGAIPYIIPMNNDEDVIKLQLSLVDGLILSGGHDVNPLLYGEEPHKLLSDIYPERDDFDLSLVKIATKLNMPILGICRGHQILNVANGGTLYQDLSLQENTYIKHNQGKLPSQGTHTVNIDRDSILCSILGDTAIVNSFHHLGIHEVGKNFKAVAHSKDGVIEAIERQNPFALGVQWHPEMMSINNKNMLNIFKYFIEQCNK